MFFMGKKTQEKERIYIKERKGKIYNYFSTLKSGFICQVKKLF